MARPQLVVVGGSAGAIEALLEIVGTLPQRFAAPMLVVVHVPATARSNLPRILERSGQLPATHAADGDRLVSGRILVAPPDRHLTIEDGRVRLENGPRENHHRPAIDPLLRSAARWYGDGVVAVILSGGSGDGITGCIAVRQRGGIVLVQEPDEALFDGMPRSVMDRVQIDAALPATSLGEALGRLIGTADEVADARPARHPAQIGGTEGSAMEDEGHEVADEGPMAFGCPECGGVLRAIDDGEWLMFRCLVGHAYSPEALLDAQVDGLESALWTALRSLEEKADLLERMAERIAVRVPDAAERYRTRAAETNEQAGVIRRFLLSPEVTSPAARGTPEPDPVRQG